MISLHESVTLEDPSLAAFIYGSNDDVITAASKAFNVSVCARGDVISIKAETQQQLTSALAFFKFICEEVKVRPGFISPETLHLFIRRSKSVLPNNTPHSEPLFITTPGRTISAHSAAQKRYVEALREHDLIFATGPAGTGKTFLAVACAVEQFTSHGFERIILCRPAVEAGEKIGFLPGDIKDKVDPYMQPLYDALRETLPPETLERLMEKKTIEIAPLAFMRGRTLKRAFIILDEAQNATRTQMKMFLTRLGEGSKIVVCGDVTQIDLPKENISGLMHAVNLTMHIDEVAYVQFEGKDVMRHPLVRQVVEAYAMDDEKRLNASRVRENQE